MSIGDSSILNISETFKQLGLEQKEDREKYVFGANTLESNSNPKIKTVYVVKYPNQVVDGVRPNAKLE